MATQEKTWNVANRLHSLKDSDNPEVNHIIAGADEIYDDTKGAKQSDINAQTETALADRYTKDETYNQQELNSLITTPDVSHVSVVATSGTTAVTDLLPAEGAADTIYRIGNWDGTQYDPTVYSLYAWNGTAYVCLAVRSFVGEVYDISANHPDGQGNPTPYVDLAAALGSDGENIPADIRRGGMSIKFIQSSDNKYVQFRLMADTFNTNVADWQGVDDEPTDGSDNLVKSGGVYDSITNSIYDRVIVSSQEYEQPTRNSGYKDFNLTSGTKYIISIQLYNFSDANIDSISDLLLYRSRSASAWVVDLVTLAGGKNAFKGNNTVKIEYTPDQDIVAFVSSFLANYSPDQNNEVRIKASVFSDKYLTKSQQTLTNEEKQTVLSNLGLTIDNEVADSPNLISNKGVYNALYEDVVYSSAEYEQIAANPPYTALRIKANSPSKVKIEFDGFNATQKRACTGFELYDSNHTEITTITNIFDGDYTKDIVEFNCAPFTEAAYIKLMFFSDTEMPASDTISIEVSETKEKYINDDGSKPLNGKTVLMLGDSITQLPYTGNNRSGMGIVEYFAEITGATTIRGGFGGSHIRARRVINSTADITDLSYVLAAFDMVYIVRALCTGDWTFQDYAIQYASEHSIDIDSYYPVMIAYLKQLDMTKVDYVTIFSGTNDYNNNVPVSDAEPTNIRYEYGAWNDILTNLSTTYHKLGVFVFTPIVKMLPDGSSWIWCEDAENEANLKLTDYVKSNMDAAYRFMFPSCDLYHTMGWNQYNFWEYFNSNDGTHPRKGYSHIARKMASFVIANQNRNFTL